jgi:uncharacterized protein
MSAFPMTGPVRAVVVALALIVWAPSVQAQQPSANAMSMARELITIKGGIGLYDAIIPGVIERAKGMLLQSNPMLGKDLNEVSAKLRADYAARVADVRDIVVRLYAARFTEQELKDALAFFKTPLGKKLIEQEPKILEESMGAANSFAEKMSDEIVPKFRAEMRKRGHEI